MSDAQQLEKLFDSGEVGAVIRHLRTHADTLDLAELAEALGRAAELMGFEDLRAAATAVRADPKGVQALYDFGYACVERGVAALAIAPLTTALELAPTTRSVLTELVAALEDEQRHLDAVRVLEAHESILRMWPDRYLLAYHSLLAGDLARATTYVAELAAPDDDSWRWAFDRLHRMLQRAALLEGALSEADPSLLSGTDLRGWHFALNGGVLGTLSPYGYEAGMHGRFAYVQDSPEQCLRGLLRLKAVLDATARRPTSVSLLPDRFSQIIGWAAAQVLGVPALPFEAGRAGTVVVAYQLGNVDADLLAQLSERADGQILFEHATCWTSPPPVTPDVSTLFGQHVIAPWEARMGYRQEGGSFEVPTDTRSVRELADEVLAADPRADAGDGQTPADSDADLARFAAAIRDAWPEPAAPRDQMTGEGPVRSNRFR